MPMIRLDDPDPAVLDGRHIRASAFETAQEELIDTLLHPPRVPAGTPRPRALTIGAGYARLPRLLADAGYRVTAIDPSARAIDAARRQAAHEDAADAAEDAESVDYRAREDAQLAEPDDSYDFVWCIDTLEVESDPRATLAEIVRVTRPGGIIVLDTLNNTLVSRTIYLGLFQRLPFTRIMPPDRYHRRRLLTPTALAAACEEAGIKIEKIIGYQPGSPVGLLRALLARRRGSIRDDELGGRARFRLSAPGHTPPVTYYAIASLAPERSTQEVPTSKRKPL